MWLTGDDEISISERFAHKFHKLQTLPIGNVCCFDDGYGLSVFWEIPNLDRMGTVIYSRLINTQIANLLSTKYIKAPIEIDNGELIVHKETQRAGILVSKYKISETELNNISGVGLSKVILELRDTREVNIHSLGEDIMSMFYNLNDSLFLASCKL